MGNVVVVHPTKVCSNALDGSQEPFRALDLWPRRWHPPHGVLVTCRCGDLGVLPLEGWQQEFLADVEQITGINVTIGTDGKLSWQDAAS